jgi:CubicO group peptidase (beta-lactamase class C family)
MAKIVGLLLFSIPTLLWSLPLNRDSILHLIPKNLTGQVVITKNDSFIFKENFGLRDRYFKTLINDSTVFNIGQVSHTIIYYLFKKLFQEKKIKPSNKINEYIKRFPYENIQIKHLLEHQSGLPHLYVKLYHRKIYNNWNLKISDRNGRFDNDDIINILINEKPTLKFLPGDSSAYSDINYLLLTSLVEKITKTSFENYVRQLFFQKLHFHPILSAKNDTLFNKAFGYRFFSDSTFQLCDNLKTRNLPFNDGTYGNQHIYLSATELALWGNFLFKKTNFDTQNIAPNKETMGGFKYDENHKIITKNGAFGGVSCKLLFIPKNQIIVVINSSILNLNSDSKEFFPLLKYLEKGL